MLAKVRVHARAALAAIACAILSACGPAADIADIMLNPTGERPDIDAGQHAYHGQFLVADLHADTLLWHRGLREYSSWGQVDLNRLRAGNVGLQVFTIATRVPVSSSDEPCTRSTNFDPAPLLAFASGWPASTWNSPYQRAVKQAEEFRSAVARKKRSGIELIQIRDSADLERWLALRFSQPGQQNPNIIAGILGTEGAHAFNPDLGVEFDTLVREYGLRLVGPIHHFTNVYGQSSEWCERPAEHPGLTDQGKRLVTELFRRKMIVDLAHASTRSIQDAVQIANDDKRPVLASHTGVRNHLKSIYGDNPSDAHKRQAINRAMSKEDIALIAGTGGTTGIIYWKDQIGAARVDNVVDAIVRAYCDLSSLEDQVPRGAFHRITNASKHISLGSDWDGAAHNAIDAGSVAAITAGLKKRGLPEGEIADIVGRNACRVIDQSLSDHIFSESEGLCTRYGPLSGRNDSGETKDDRKSRLGKLCEAHVK